MKELGRVLQTIKECNEYSDPTRLARHGCSQKGSMAERENCEKLCLLVEFLQT